tara:strand:- start:535 stop:714 length:180 start_codon:yes stop_codon:yes gene_type:complete
LDNSNKEKICSLFKSDEDRKSALLKEVNLEAKPEDAEAIKEPQISFIGDKGYKSQVVLI